MDQPHAILTFDAAGSDGRLYTLVLRLGQDGQGEPDNQYFLQDGRPIRQTGGQTYALVGGALTFLAEP
jgi:hypothetical protein